VKEAYPADQVLVVREVGFAGLAAVDLVAGEVVIVRQTHGTGFGHQALVEGLRCVTLSCWWKEAPWAKLRIHSSNLSRLFVVV
jgi:hypothetical protein